MIITLFIITYVLIGISNAFFCMYLGFRMHYDDTDRTAFSVLGFLFWPIVFPVVLVVIGVKTMEDKAEELARR